MQTNKRAVLFVNGQAKPGFEVSLLPGDFLVAVDGGLRHLKRLGLKPDFLIGDLDSIDASEVAEILEAGIEVHRFPPAKDQTDLELALEYALSLGYAQIVIAYPFGDRVDHTLGNLSLLARPDLAGRRLSLDDGQVEARLLDEKASLPTQPGDLVSLIPWGEPVEGITTKGLEYPLNNETLVPWQSRGISNVALADSIELDFKSGRLLVIKTNSISGG
ncbi:MAG TPA: thiamine diphosphokinase [Anaerolineaceae bacterium]|nr:thiamine diphosphokinase [Anaerolineaceae bacterium]